MEHDRICAERDENVDLSLVMPCYNEEDVLPLSIPPLLHLCEKLALRYEVILVNNGSWDSTPQVIDSFISQGYPVRRVDVSVNQGYGWGILCGMKQARGEYIAYLCCDGQIVAEDVVLTYQAIQGTERGVIAKVRRVNRADGLWRSFMSGLFNMMFFIMYGAITPDVNGVPKIFHRDDLQHLRPISKDAFIDPELMVKAKVLGLKIIEVPTVFYKRPGGSSKVGMLLNSPEFLKNMMRYRFERRFKDWLAEERSRH